MKFLVIRFGSVGDIILTTPVVRCLKKQLPLAEVHYLLESRFKDIIGMNPFIDKHHSLRQDHYQLINELRSENFDAIIDLQNDSVSRNIKRQLKVPAFRYKNPGVLNSLLQGSKDQFHLVDRFLKTLQPFGVENDGLGPEIFISKEHLVAEKDIPASHHLGYVGLLLDMFSLSKKFTSRRLHELCKALDHPVILLGSDKEFANAERLSSVDPIKIYNACGKFSLQETADLVRRSKMLVSMETGWMQMAAAFRKPLLVLHERRRGMIPYYGEFSQQQLLPFERVQLNKTSTEEIVQKINKRLRLLQNSNSFTSG